MSLNTLFSSSAVLAAKWRGRKDYFRERIKCLRDRSERELGELIKRESGKILRVKIAKKARSWITSCYVKELEIDSKTQNWKVFCKFIYNATFVSTYTPAFDGHCNCTKLVFNSYSF